MEHFFHKQFELDRIDYTFVSPFELIAGSIRSIAVSAAFLAASEGAPIRMAHIARAAAREYSKLSKPISSADFGPCHGLVRT